jgi:hypothetical protein
LQTRKSDLQPQKNIVATHLQPGKNQLQPTCNWIITVTTHLQLKKKIFQSICSIKLVVTTHLQLENHEHSYNPLATGKSLNVVATHLQLKNY